MGIMHKNADHGAEMDAFRDCLAQFETKITRDEEVDNNTMTIVEYVNGEGDAPFVKYRMTLEAIATLSEEEYRNLKSSETSDDKEENLFHPTSASARCTD